MYVFAHLGQANPLGAVDQSTVKAGVTAGVAVVGMLVAGAIGVIAGVALAGAMPVSDYDCEKCEKECYR